MICAEDFQAAMTGLLQMLPMQRQLTGPALVMAWDTFPLTAKQQLSERSLAWACGQRLMDPAPPKELAAHLSVLRYLYPLENDRPVVERGLRSDLADRMAAPDRFHDPAPVRQEHAAPPPRPQLTAGSGYWHPSQLTEEQRRRHVEGVGAHLEHLLTQELDDRSWSPAQLSQGRWWFAQALAGFWPLQADRAGIAVAWVQRHGSEARQLVADALVVPVEAVPVGAVLSGFEAGGGGSW